MPHFASPKVSSKKESHNPFDAGRAAAANAAIFAADCYNSSCINANPS
jgi:hypothetical protein